MPKYACELCCDAAISINVTNIASNSAEGTESLPTPPISQGLYDPTREHDSCGIGFVADIRGQKSHAIIRDGLAVLANLDHRGGVGADPLLGDGAGCMIQLPDALVRAWAEREAISLPASGSYAVAMCFLPRDDAACVEAVRHFERVVAIEGQIMLGWREVPSDASGLGANVLAAMPVIRQAIVARGPRIADQDAFERKLLVIRKQVLNPIAQMAVEQSLPGLAEFYIASFSTRTLVYKGQLLATQLGSFYLDLVDPRTVSALAMVHQRFSTNTFPSWKLAHPYRFISHNGEINTVRGNVNWMNARRRTMESPLLGADLVKMWPLIPHGQSDTASLDNALELLVAGGYPLAHAMMMLVPEAWAGNAEMDPARRAFYEYHAALMEPWDGPAAIAFSDGRQIGAMLDRNGLRPARVTVTDERVILASESGVLEVPESQIVRKWRLEPGRMLLIDLEAGRIVDDLEIKSTLSNAVPYGEWLRETQIKLEDLPAVAAAECPVGDLAERLRLFGYTEEDLKLILRPMAGGTDPLGSMGTDTPIAVLSRRPRLLFDYFKQNFAQVTNPAIDPIREAMVMSLVSMIGPRPNLLGRNAGTFKRLEVAHPILSNGDLDKIRSIHDAVDGAFRTATIDATWSGGSGAVLEAALQRLCWEATEAVLSDSNVLILSDRAAGAGRVPIPIALATGAVHHQLIRQGLRMQTGLVVETGEAREVHHFCVLAGYGAEAINPYLAYDAIEGMDLGIEAFGIYRQAAAKGVLKVMSKMGISTFQSYCGAQAFDSIGLSTALIDKYFTGTAAVIEGAGIDAIAAASTDRHAAAFAKSAELLDFGGAYAYRVEGEHHAWTPDTIADLQHAARGNIPEKYASFADAINDSNRHLLTIRGLFNLVPAGPPVALDEVEEATEIVKRFSTGAMSFGSISREAHTTLAIAMNRIGAQSNTGEGGEEQARFAPMANGDSARSAIKQVASGRFGVTTEYLVNADCIQIKVAQGAKPGEGGQLPGDKIDRAIAAVRHSTPGVGLISPPPHHDIYSIEDLAQLIHDLKCVNPSAQISVKLVSQVGVGTVAAGVAKSMADHVTIAGFDGGTGAAPLTSLTHAGLPWEIGLAETQQTLVLNGLRSRIRVQADGGLRTGRDVAIAAILGADEFGFATAPLVAAGCIMMRKCHLNSCPVGIATQNPVLRERFTGQPEHVINYFFFVAEELRVIMASLGLRTVDEMIGRPELIDSSPAVEEWRVRGIDLGKLLFAPPRDKDAARFNTTCQNHALSGVLDHVLIKEAAPALEHGESVRIVRTVSNVDRSLGAMLSGEVARRFGHKGLDEGTIHIALTGTAGQSFGAFLAHGVTLELVGDANDYVGKGLSGGTIIVAQPDAARRDADANIIVGNTCLYGAVAGSCFFNGVAGERFAVRNSGATAVVEGAGDHACEYMTGGVVVILGAVGRNFGAGMSGGIAYVYDPERQLAAQCARAGLEIAAIEPSDHPDADLGDPLRFDAERLRGLIKAHQAATGSARASGLLDDWTRSLRGFVKVISPEYRRALSGQAVERPVLLEAVG